MSSFNVEVHAPELIVEDVVVDDSPGGGNGNGCAEPGETVSISVSLENVGSEEALDVTAVLSTDDPHAVVNAGTAGTATVASGGSASLAPAFDVTILPTAPFFHTIEFDLAVTTASGYATIEQITLTVGGGLEEAFEGSGGDWTHYVVSSGFADQWHVETYRSHSSSHSWKFGGTGSNGYTDSADGGLETPSLCVGSGGEMTFWHWLDAEEENSSSAWDCALVEISTNGGSTWSVLVPNGGYSHAKNDNAANPLPEGTPCWSGSFGWRQETFDLTAYEGTNAIMRFRFASDAYVTEEGWYIDDIAVTSSSTGVDDGDPTVAAPEFTLRQNAPNPFNPVTTIGYALPEAAHVTISVYNVAGALVTTLVDAEEDAGSRAVVWDGTNGQGRKVGSGVYLYRMTAGSFTDERVMVLLK